MVHPHSVPVAPDTSLLQQFNTCFKTPEEIHKTAESKTSVPLIPQSQVLTLKGIQPGQKKNLDERHSDQNFTEKYWEINTDEYDLSHEISTEDEDSGRNYNEAESSEYSDQSNSNSEADNSAMEEELEFSFSLDRDTVRL
ncbi:hypothetical protein O181_104358 [Austropuccinia psidii MF-1]|uniref:Uncharacterized protein n=1 Tax=Austropuccinia psidii MF-1 TaxID=1389203 RepID=A0A9Q3JM35_9BASI|nr:hypothetical protein [Austropuccinia psidii MF-1]